MKTNHRLIIYGRIGIFILLGSFIVLGPSAQQLFGHKLKYFRTWRMYRGGGLGVFVAEFRLQDSNGTQTPIDRFQVLGYSSKNQAPRSLVQIENQQQALSIARRLCQRLGQKADVRLYTRKASRRGWEWIAQGETNLCDQ
ncbi:MAG: hypothetical protein ACREOW_14050 [Thermodesulfobacteriota bacterium]